MGCCSKLCSKLCCPKEYRILMSGLRLSGKTAILRKFQAGGKVEIISPFDSPFEFISCGRLNITVSNDNGKRVRVLWLHYLSNTDGIIYIIDCNEEETIDDALEELKKMVNEKELAKKPFLILCNKIDLEKHIPPDEIKIKIENRIPEINEKKWEVMGTSAVTGVGIEEALEWLRSTFP